MELGQLWMTQKVRIISILTGLALLMLSIGVYYYSLPAQPKHITLTVDGVAQTFETQANTVEEFLSQQNINIADSDIITPNLSTPISEALTVQLQKSWEVPIQVDGQTKRVHTATRDVQDILKEAGITLGEKDKVQPALNVKIAMGNTISITRVKEQIVKVEKVVPFQELKKEDKAMARGDQKILQQGREGKVLLQYRVTTENGKEMNRELVKTEIVTPKMDRVVAIGSKRNNRPIFAGALASRGGTDFTSRRVLKGVYMTAYSPETGSRTATGARAIPGRTIAVDPDVIPLGWWVYIEGVGYRRAEDTGGAIKGKKIDVFVGSEDQANDFGVRTANTVHIIGPKLPR